MDDRASPDLTRFTLSTPSCRAVLGLALGAALGAGVMVPTGMAAAQPKSKHRGEHPPGPHPRQKPRRRPRHRPRPRYKQVSRTFTSLIPVRIPDKGEATPYPSIIQVGGLRGGKIKDVNVTLNGLSHSYPADIEVILVAPNERTSTVLMSNAGGDFDVTNVTLVFDDKASIFLPYEQQIESGVFKPTLPGLAPRPETSSLGTFNGLNPNGTWRLFVVDRTSNDEGSIGSWALTIQARVRIGR